MASGFVIGSLAFLAGLIWLGIWVFRKIMHGEMGVGANTALLALLLLILLVPFAMNLSAHFMYEKILRSSEATEGAARPN